MQQPPDQIVESAIAQVGGYLLMHYRDARGDLQAANAVSALGAWAGMFAQIQARVLSGKGVIEKSETALLEVKTNDGQTYYFGDAINACLFEQNDKFLSFWNLAASAANDPDIAKKIDVREIAKRTSQGVGGAMFGQPKIDPAYKLSERPIDALRRHGPGMQAFLVELGLDPAKLMLVFGAVAQHFAMFAAGEAPDIRVAVPMKRVDIVRLYMEAAIPMSKLDPAVVDMS